MSVKFESNIWWFDRNTIFTSWRQGFFGWGETCTPRFRDCWKLQAADTFLSLLVHGWATTIKWGTEPRTHHTTTKPYKEFARRDDLPQNQIPCPSFSFQQQSGVSYYVYLQQWTPRQTMPRTDCKMIKAEFKVMKRTKEYHKPHHRTLSIRHTLLTLSSLSKIDHTKMCILKCKKTLQKLAVTFVCPSV